MRAWPRWLAVAVVVPALAASGAAVPAAALPGVGLPAAPVPDDPGRLLLLLDSSAAMRADDAAGRPKVEGVRAALLGVLPTLVPRALTGVRLYGAGMPPGRQGSCQDTELAVPLGAGNRPLLAAAATALRPVGTAALGHGLRQVLRDVGPAGARRVVVVAAGADACGRDACQDARGVGSSGLDITVDVIGVHVSRSAEQQLRCIAAAGRGRYVGAATEVDLRQAVLGAVARATRAVGFAGTQVSGAEALTALGPHLSPGLYADRLGPRGTLRGYRITTTAGSAHHVSVSLPTLPTRYDAPDAVRLRLLDQDGGVCAEQEARRSLPGAGAAAGAASAMDALLVASVTVAVPASEASAPGPCGVSGDVRVVVSRDTARSSAEPGWTPFELNIVSEPPVLTTAGLPAAQAEALLTTVTGPQRARAVTGGSTPALAATLTPGAWSDTVAPAETRVYRVRTGWGQRAVLTLTAGPVPGGTAAEAVRLPVGVRVLTSVRSEVAKARKGGTLGDPGLSLTTASRTARYLNREADPAGRLDLPGYQYFVVQAGQSAAGRVWPVRLAVAVTGSLGGEPAYRLLGSRPAPEPTTTSAAVPSTAATAPLPPREVRGEGGRGGSAGWLVALGLLAGGSFGSLAWRIGHARRGGRG